MSRERDVPIKIYLPASHDPAPVVLFSHGLGGTRKGCVYLGRHWSARGYVAVFLQHPGSDASVWKDRAPIGGQTVESRLAVFPNLPDTIDRGELVLHNAEHSAFTDRALPGDKEPRNPNHQRAILAISTAFWDAYLRGDADAKAWLRDSSPQSILETKDRWQFNTASQ